MKVKGHEPYLEGQMKGFSRHSAEVVNQMTQTQTQTRSLNAIAREIAREWRDPKTGQSKVWFGAKPYLDAMMSLDSIDDMYGCDSALSIVAYFLANASTFRGDAAKRLKAELKAIAGIK
jgi:hypothetical protein